jgi:3-dehydroquinate dehydratase/shikimate dehydrogenase
MLIASIVQPRVEWALKEIEKALPLAEGIELRLDALKEEELARVEKIVSKAPLPLIFTFRKKEQGGLREISEDERLEKFEKLLGFSPAYADIETDTDPRFIARAAQKTRVIGSYHDFKSTPLDLDASLAKIQNPHFAILKMAFYAKSSLDLMRLMVFTARHSSTFPMCCISMGEFGKPSRVMGKILGNVLDYSGVEEDLELTRYSLQTLCETFHYKELSSKTKIYALLGDPIEKSRSHTYHNSKFSSNAVYLKIRVQKEELEEFFRLSRLLPFGGFSVTIPHKEKILPLLDRIEAAASKMGAVNTILIRENEARGFNTDAPGALNAIERHVQVKGKRVAILGAGGTARAIAFEAKKRGGIVKIYNRTLSKAKILAEALEVEARSIGDLRAEDYDLLVSTLPPIEGGELSIALDAIRAGAYVMDVVTAPNTPLLRAAKEKGCYLIFGSEMFEEQAALQQMEWKK